MGMVRLGGIMTVHTGRLQALMVGVAVRQSLTPTARSQAALAGRTDDAAPTWRAALAGLPATYVRPPARAEN